MTPTIHLQGKVALVTGGSRGIGEAVARVFAQNGARVAIASRKREGIDAAAERIASSEGVTADQVAAFTCHTGKPDDVAALIKDTVARFGGLDIVVNNAATNPHFGPLVTADHGAFAKTFEVNARGYLDVALMAARHWVDAEVAGSIINVASVVALTGAPLQGIYAMTKAAVVSMTRRWPSSLGRARSASTPSRPGWWRRASRRPSCTTPIWWSAWSAAPRSAVMPNPRRSRAQRSTSHPTPPRSSPVIRWWWTAA